jgi:rhamnosyltransferase subunit B
VAFRILLGWEFGGGFGHIVRLREIARQIGENQSCEFIFALQKPHNGVSAGLPGRSVIPAPVPRRSAGSKRPQDMATYGEFVSHNLMIDEGAFAWCLAGWEKICRDSNPDLIIADYAPGLSLYARGRWPVLAIGSGYTLPPPEMADFPPITSLKRPRSVSEPEIMGRLNKDLGKIGARPIERLPQLNEADAYGIMTIPIFDPYEVQRRQPYLGTELPGGMPSPQATSSGAIAYFHEDTQLHDNVLDGFAQASIDTEAYFGRPLRRLVKKFKGSRISLAEVPFTFREDMPGKAVAVHKGGLGFAVAAVLAGVPQVMLYKHQEHWLTANAIVRAGAGVAASYREVSASTLSETIDRVAASSAMREGALRLAQENAGFRNANPTGAVAEIALGFL